MKVGDCNQTWLNGAFSNGMIVSHFFNPKHGSTGWGWEESICLCVECVPMPEDIIVDAQ